MYCLRGLQPNSSAKAAAPEASKKDASSTKRTSSKHRDKSASKSKDKRAADKTSNDTGDKPAPIRKPRKAAADDTKATAAVDAAVKDEATGKETVAAETVAKPAMEEAVPEADAGVRVKENDAAAAEVAVKDTDSTPPVAADVTASAVSLDDVKAEVHDDKAPHDASAQVRHSPVMVSSGDSNHMIELQADEKSDVNKPVNANDLTPEQRALKSDAEAAVTAGVNKNSAGDMLAPAATAASDNNSSEPEVTSKQAKKEPQKTAAQAPSPKKERSRSGARGTPSSTSSAAPSTKPTAAAAPSAKPAADDSRRREAEEAKAKLAERRKEARERAQREAEEAARREAEEK